MDRETNDRLWGFFLSFGITFLAMVLVLGSICIAAWSRTRTAPDTQPRLTQTRPDTYLPEPADRLTLLVAAAEEKDAEPSTYLLLGFLPDQGKISICVLPAATYVEYGGQGSTLGRLWTQGGLPYAQKALAQYLDIPIHRRAFLDTQALDALLSYGEIMDYQLAVDLNYTVRGRQVDMPRGRYQLDGRKTMDIITCPAYQGGERERSDRAALLISQLVSHTLPLFLTEEDGSRFQSLALSVLDTDLSASDCLRRSAALEFLARLELPATTSVFLEGSLSKNRTVYHLTENCKDRIYGTYRDPTQPDRRSFSPDLPLVEEVDEPVSDAEKPRPGLDSGLPPIQEHAVRSR